MKQKKPLHKKILKLCKNIVSIIILKSVWRRLFWYAQKIELCHRLNKIAKKCGKPVVIYANTFDYYSPIPQRPNHMFNILVERGYPCIFYSNKRKLTQPRKNLFALPKRLFMDMLKCDFPKVFDISFCFPYDDIHNFFDYLDDKTLVIYEFIDDFDLLFNPEIIKQAKLLFRDLIQRDNTFVLASADALYNEAKLQNAKHLLLSKNAVNIHDFEQEPSYIPAEIQKLKLSGKKIVGYYGAITASWFDFDLVSNFIKENPDYAFVLIGLIYHDDNLAKTEDYIAKLSKYDNFVYIPPIKYQDIPNYAKHWDVATIPFQINEITKSTSPVKLFEYMAMGLPIVTTPMTECKLYKSVFIADDADDFTAKIKTAISNKNNKKYMETLHREAAENTWDKRVNDFIQIIENNYKG